MCKYTTRSPFPLWRGWRGWGEFEEGSGCRGGLLWSKLYLRLKLKTALSTQLEPDISHLPLLGWKSMWWGILQCPPPSFSSVSLSLSLFFSTSFSLLTASTFTGTSAAFLAFVSCSHAPLGHHALRSQSVWPPSDKPTLYGRFHMHTLPHAY